MPNTSQDDVNALLQTLLDEKGVTRDLQRSAVRTLLFEASPAFADAADPHESQRNDKNGRKDVLKTLKGS